MFRWMFDPKNARFAVLLLMVVLVAAAVIFLRAIMLPFFLAIFLAYLLDPIIRQMQRPHIKNLRLPRGAAVLLIYAVLGGVLVLSGYYGVPKLSVELDRMVRSLPNTITQIEQDLVQPLASQIDRILNSYVGIPPSESLRAAGGLPRPDQRGPVTANPGAKGLASDSELRAAVENYMFIVRQTDDSHYEIFAKRRPRPMGINLGRPLTVDQQLDQAFKDFRNNLETNAGDLLLGSRYLLRHISAFVVNTFLVFMLAAFLLVNPGRINAFFRSMVPPQHQATYTEWLGRLDHGLSGVVRGQVMICLINGTVTAAGIYYLHVPFWFTLSIVATVCSLIPIFGVLISSVPIVIMALSVSPYTALAAVVWILLIHFVEGNFLNPKILGEAAKIHPVLIVFALITGEYFNGVLGALLAVPIFSVFYNTFHYLQTLAEKVERLP